MQSFKKPGLHTINPAKHPYDDSKSIQSHVRLVTGYVPNHNDFIDMLVNEVRALPSKKRTELRKRIANLDEVPRRLT